jgi:hypothetical protein
MALPLPLLFPIRLLSPLPAAPSPDLQSSSYSSHSPLSCSNLVPRNRHALLATIKTEWTDPSENQLDRQSFQK